MTTELAHHVRTLPMVDTHEHLRRDDEYAADGPDVLRDLFGNYLQADLVVAGATPAAVARLLDSADPDIAARFAGAQTAWGHCQYTGYGEATRLTARLVYGLEEITAEGLVAAQTRNAALRQPGERLRLLRDMARLDHVQTDNFRWDCLPDPAAPDFFLYDLSWNNFCAGQFDAEAVRGYTGVEITDVRSLQEAMVAIFAKTGGRAIAVKSQHAYTRTLLWRERTEAEVEPVLRHHLAGHDLTEGERLCLGDWCWSRGVELAIEHNLPFKIHTGYYAGHSRMPVERIRPGHLCALLARYPAARFVLMHIAYPYTEELVALAKHYPNVWMDMCWSWSINPRAATEFVRRVIHAVPANKLFTFGGDTFWPASIIGYAAQARDGLTRALQGEVDDGFLTERAAIALATRFMRTNQEECFDLAGTRAAIHAAMREAANATSV